MSPPSKVQSTKWASRPKRFYEDWNVFCVEALGVILKEQEGMFAIALLAGGAVLGAGGVVALAQANKEYFDRKGLELGIPNLGALMIGGGAVFGAAMGSLGGFLLNKTLGKNVDGERLAAMQGRLTAARREFDVLKQDLRNELLDPEHHRLAVERLFLELTRAQDRG